MLRFERNMGMQNTSLKVFWQTNHDNFPTAFGNAVAEAPL